VSGELQAQQPAALPDPATVPQLRLVGRIVSVVHDGVPAAEVWVSDAAGKVLGRTIADGDGYYQLPRLPNGTLQLHAKAAGRVPGRIEVVAHGRMAAATLPLEDGVPLAGTVVTPDGKPVAGAGVLVLPLPELAPPFAWYGEVTTDAAGAWSLPAVPMRRLLVRVFAPGHALSDVEVERGTVAVPVRLVADATPPRQVRLKNWPAGVQGVVRIEASRDPQQRWWRLPSNLAEAAVAADGTARLWPLGKSHEVRVAVAGYRTMPVCAMCAAGATKDLEFELIPRKPDDLTPDTAVHGVVQDAVGKPLAGITVLGRSHGVAAVPVQSDADGSFRLQMPARAGVLCELSIASDEWCLGDPRASLEVDGRCWLSVSTDPAGKVLLHSIRSGSVRGVLLGPNGTPLAAAAVHLRPRAGTAPGGAAPPAVVAATDPAGRLQVVSLPPGGYQLTAFGDGLLPVSLEVEVPVAGSVEPGPLPFAPAGEIRGVVLDGAGSGVGGALLGTYIDDRRLPAGLRRQLMASITSGAVLTDRSGRFRVAGVAAGNWSVFLRSETEAGAANGEAQTVPLTAGEVVTLEFRR
jgi:hypothetical protein